MQIVGERTRVFSFLPTAAGINLHRAEPDQNTTFQEIRTMASKWIAALSSPASPRKSLNATTMERSQKQRASLHTEIVELSEWLASLLDRQPPTTHALFDQLRQSLLLDVNVLCD